MGSCGENRGRCAAPRGTWVDQRAAAGGRRWARDGFRCPEDPEAVLVCGKERGPVKELKLNAYAKVNLSLDVLARRPDG
ncbi:MAG: hypothetical protein ACK45F_10345, partial [bacterium]